MQDCHGKSSIQPEDSIHQQTEIKIKEKSNKVKDLEHSFV
jgi:hypothetical protein